MVHIPWLTALWGLEIALRVLVLQQGRWTTLTRWAEYGISLLGLYVAYRIFRSDPITISAALDLLVRFGLGIAVLVGAVSVVITPFKLLLSRPAPRDAEEVVTF